MNRKHLFRTAFLPLSAACVIGATSCIDKDYRIDKIDKGIKIAPNGFSIPLGYLERKSLGDLIDKDVIAADGDTGDYMLRYGGRIDYRIGAININNISFGSLPGLLRPVEIDPQGDGNWFPESVTIAGESMEVPLDNSSIPSFDMSGETVIEKLDLRKEGGLPGGLSGTVGAGLTFSGSVESGAEASIAIDVSLPEQVAGVRTVWLKDKNGSPNAGKATVTFTFEPGGLAPVTASLMIDRFAVALPERYTISPGTYPGATVTQTGKNTFTVENYNPGPAPYEIVFYIDEMDLSDLVPGADNEIAKTENFAYAIDYTLTTKAGTVGTGNPAARISGSPDFLDAEFTTKAIDFKTEPYPYTHNISHTIEGLVDVVKKIDYAAFADDGQNTFTLTLESPGLPQPFLDELPVTVTFPASFDMAKVSSDGSYDNSSKKLTATAGDFVAGYAMKLKGIRFGAGEGIPSGGKLTIGGDMSVGISHTFAAGKQLKWSVDVRGKSVPESLGIATGGMNLALNYGSSIYELNAVSQDISGSGNISKEFDVPSAIKGITGVIIEQAGAAETGVSVEMTLSVEIKDRFAGLEEFYLDNFTVRLPSFLVIDEDKLNLSLGDGESFDARTGTYTNKLVTIRGDRALLAKFPIKGLGGINIDNTKGYIAGNFEFSATARTPENIAINPGDREMTITPVLEISDIRLTGLEGVFDIDLDQSLDGRIEPIDFTEVFDILGDDSQQPDLAAPVMTFTVENPLGINFLGSIGLTPKDGNGNPTGNPVVLENFRIDAAKGSSQKETKIYITDNGAESAPQGYTGYNSPLSHLVNIIPHTIDIDISGRANPDASLVNSLLLGDDDYAFGLDYMIEVPLVFGPDMDMTMVLDADDLNGTFSELAERKVKAADITVHAGLTVSFPLKLEGIEVEFTDAQGSPIPGLTTTVTGSIEGPAAGNSPQKSKLSIKLGVPQGGDMTTLSKIDVLKIKVPIRSADSSKGAENRLNAADWIEGNVWLELAKGVSADLGEL